MSVKLHAQHTGRDEEYIARHDSLLVSDFSPLCERKRGAILKASECKTETNCEHKQMTGSPLLSM